MLFRDEENELIEMSVAEILEEINRDRSDSWSPYDETDWEDGVQWTTLTLVKK